MKKAKQLTALILALVICLAFSACGGGGTPATEAPAATNPLDAVKPTEKPPEEAPPEEAPPEEEDLSKLTAREGVIQVGDVVEAPEGAKFADSIDIVVGPAVSLLDPLSSASAFPGCTHQFNMMFDKLIYLTPGGEYIGELATDWETEDYQNYTFHLREGVTFHNGAEFTAQDVIDTCELAMAPEANGSNATDAWRDVVSITAEDDYTLKIELSIVDSSFIHKLSVPGAVIVNKAAREADPIEGVWVGTGAFILTEFVSSDHSILVRNDDYWGEAPLTRQVTFRAVPEVAARTVMQLNGDTDMNIAIGPEDLDMFVEDPGYNVYGFAQNATHSLTFGMLNPITGDKNFRLAVAYAINREEAAQAASGNWCKVNHDGTFWGDTTPYRATDIPERTQDLDKAKEYLEASDYNGEEVELMCGPETLTLSAQMVAEQLSMIGINVKLFPTDNATLVNKSIYGNENLQMLHFVSPFTLDPASARNMLYPAGSANRGSYNNPEVNDLIDKALTVGDPAELKEIYVGIQEIVAEDIPQISLYERIQTVVTRSDMGGIVINADNYHDFRGIFKIVG